MTKLMRLLFIGAFVLLAAAPGLALDLTIYDDALQNGFQNYSYGGGSNFASTTYVHSGTYSISFVGNNFNAVSFAHLTVNFSTAQYPTLRFWVHGGTAGGQQLRIILQLGAAIVAQALLATYIAGGSIAAGAWRQVTVNFGQAPLSYSGSFNRNDLQSDVAGTQPALYIDDVNLVPGGAPPANLMQIEHDVNIDPTVPLFLSDRFTWRDAADKTRVAVLTHNNPEQPQGPTAIGGYPNHGGALREFRYQLPDNTTRICNVTTYGNGGYGGFGYVVSHRGDGTAGCGCDDSPLG